MARAAKKSAGGKINLAPRVKKKKSTRNPLFMDEKYTGPEPEWDTWESWSFEKFRKTRHWGYFWYNYFSTAKEMIPQITKWMGENEYSKDDIKAFKAAPDHRCSVTMGSTASMLLRGMPASHPEDPENNTASWLKGKIDPVIIEGKEILKNQKVEEKVTGPVLSIQDRIREASLTHMEGIVDWLETWLVNPAKFDPKALNPINFFKGREINQAHARVIRDFYEPLYNEITLLVTPPKVKDEMYAQLVEGYRAYTKPQLKTLLEALEAIMSATNMFLQQAKVNRKPRAKKSPSKEKLVSKLKFKTHDDRYKLVSIKPEEAAAALELWVFNTKTRKLGVYVASDTAALSVKGTTIINFNEDKSIAKTLRKPEEQLKDANKLPKTKMRNLFNDVNSIETKMNGRINADVILLKAYT